MRSLTRVSVLMGPPWLFLEEPHTISNLFSQTEKPCIKQGPIADRSRCQPPVTDNRTRNWHLSVPVTGPLDP